MRVLDVLIQGGTIVDGSGQNRFVGDVGVQGNRIVTVANQITDEAHRTIDATGFTVCPGFIDVHAHDDLAVLYDPALPYKILQGVTTTIIGNCGHSVAPMPENHRLRDELRQYMEPVLGRWPGDDHAEFGYEGISEFYDDVRKSPTSLNVSALVGHGPLRVRVMGFSNTPASPAEIAEMQRLLRDAMAAGALGLSFGLMYTPGCFAKSDELLALAETVKAEGGIVTSHIRGEGDLLLPSIQEMLEIAKVTGVAMHISHLKAVGRKNWGTVNQAIEMIRSARLAGLDVTCDAYPYAAGSTTLLSLLPPSALHGGVRGVLDGLSDDATRRQIQEALEAPGDGWDNVAYLTGWDRVVLVSSPGNQAFEGLSIEAIAEQFACSTTEAYFRVIEANKGTGTIIIHHMDEMDVQQVLAFEYATIGSDGLPSPDGHPHPRLYGTFPRLISKYVGESSGLTLEQAVQKATNFPADRFKLGARGRIQVGAIADIVVLDNKQYVDVATYENPKQFTPGLVYVLVGGEVTVDNGALNDVRKGTLICRNDDSSTVI